MLFKKKNDTNMITDEEVNVGEKNQNKAKFKFVLPFTKKKKNLETVPGEANDTNQPNNNQPGIDFNNDFIKNNHSTKSNFKKIIGLITDIIIIILVLWFIIWSAPKIINWFSGGRDNYVDLAKSMAIKVQKGYAQPGQGCTSAVNHRFFYNINNSKEQFGDDFVSPINKQPMEGYIEFEAYKSGYTTYITLTDGFFGINHVQLEKLTKSDVKIFTFLGLDNYPDMDCDKPIVITKK